MVVIEGKLVLLDELRRAPSFGEGAARDRAAVLGMRLEWKQMVVNAPSTVKTPSFSAGDSGVDLIGGRVRWPLDENTHAKGVVLNYDPTGELYEIQLTDQKSVVATPSELLVLGTSDTDQLVAWQVLNVTLMPSIEDIKGHRTVEGECVQPNPFTNAL
jgi:hypothetical protein